MNKKKWLPSKTFAILFNVMILQHIKKSSTSGSDIFFISRVYVRVYVCMQVCASIIHSPPRGNEGNREDKKRCWGRRISVIVDFVNPSLSFVSKRSREERKTKNIQNQKYPRLCFPLTSTKEKCSRFSHSFPFLFVPRASKRAYTSFSRVDAQKKKKKKIVFPLI